jgi:hypothetical protein
MFARWGRPQRLRVDNGGPWGSTAGLPTVLELWLVGLEVDLSRNQPHSPQENGVVEQSHGTGKRWTEPHRCSDAPHLQQRVNDEDRIQREVYPYQGEQSRWEVFADLRHSGRGYALGWERACWDLERVLRHLSGYRVPRKVSRQGKVSVYERDRMVGATYAGQRVLVEFAAQTHEWRILNLDKHEIRRRPAPEINAVDIEQLCLSRRRPPSADG